MQPVEDPPLGQRDDGVRLAARVVLQRPVRVYESLVLLLEGHDPRREEAAEAEAVALRQGERRVLIVPWVVEDVGAALVHDAGPRHGGAGGRRGRGRRQEPPDLRRPPRRRTPHRGREHLARCSAGSKPNARHLSRVRGGAVVVPEAPASGRFEGGRRHAVRAPAVSTGRDGGPGRGGWWGVGVEAWKIEGGALMSDAMRRVRERTGPAEVVARGTCRRGEGGRGQGR